VQPSFFKAWRIFILSSLLIISCSRFPRIVILEDPLTAEEHNQLGTIYEAQGKYELAAKEYEMALKKDPHLNQARVNLGNVLLAQKDYAGAEEAYRQALEVEPENADTLNNLAWLYLERRERLSEAEGLAQKALQIKPSSRMYYLDTLGMALLLQGRLVDAEEAFWKALEVMPSDQKALQAEVYYHLALVYKGKGESEKMEEAVEKIRELDGGRELTRQAEGLLGRPSAPSP